MHIYIYYSKKVLPNISRTKLFIKFKTINTCMHSPLVCIVNRQRYIAQSVYHLITNKNSPGDEIANVNFCTTTTYMERPAPTPIEPTC